MTMFECSQECTDTTVLCHSQSYRDLKKYGMGWGNKDLERVERCLDMY